MNKKTKKIIIAILIVISCFGLYKIVDATSYTFVRMKAEAYLCQKYDAKPSEIELVDYKPAHIYWDDYYIFWLTPKWSDFSFEYRYKDRNFFVNRTDGKFYDDYQLEDIEKWCTEWLKENIDESIVGLDIDSNIIENYYKNTNKSSYETINEEDAEGIINKGFEINVYYIYYYDENVDEKFIFKYNEEFNKKFHSKRYLYDGLEAYYLKSNLVVFPEKRNDFNWVRYYVSVEYYEDNYVSEKE